jgi:predicted negative regulator of RcsB-dependent stress response
VRHSAYYAAVIIIFTLAVSGCSVEKNTGASRFFYSLISKYNIWFNGNEAYKAGIQKIKASHRDDYSMMLPVFEYSSPESVRVASSDMERAIQKASKLIALYSITARPDEKDRRNVNSRSEEFYNRREFNEWIDDAYILMAKAQFYQKNFTAARSSLSYTMNIASDPDLTTEAGIWMARIHTEEGNYPEASRLLQTIEDPENLSRPLKAMYYTTRADIALRQKRYGDAITPLTLATDYAEDKDTRVRLTYLLAQVCRAAGENDLSTRYFTRVIRMNPPYDLEFNADINLAGVTDISHGDADDLMRSLRRMLRDSKNKDYLDQIYFALGDLEERMGNTDEALKLWARSAASSTVNNRQRARSYLALADHYYDQPDYMTAWHYYDSASYLLDDRYPDYDAISSRASDLSEYAQYHDIVITEDSLRRVASMSEVERDALIAEIIRSVTEEQANMAPGSSDRYNMGLYYENEQRSRGTISAEGGWYFYNQSALTFGRTEFRRRWGDRRLEDNWRRSNKAHMAFSNAATTENNREGERSDTAAVAPDRTREYYLGNLPLTDSLMKESVRKSADALLAEGKILASRLSDTLSAAESLEQALRTADNDEIKSEALYEIYRLLRTVDPARAERRRAELLAAYPESEYTLILSDPDYVRKQQELSSMASRSYDKAYLAFNNEEYSEVLAICNDALELYQGNELIPKFMLLDAMATGALEGEIPYKGKLDSLVNKYPSTDEGRRAAEIIEVLRKEVPAIKEAEDIRIAEELYKADTLQPHYVIIIARNSQANMNQIVFDVINYNLDNYTQNNYRTEGTAVDRGYTLITTGPFGNASEASAWLAAFNPSVNIRGADSADLLLFIISRDNLEKFREDKDIDRYMIFYGRSYSSMR